MLKAATLGLIGLALFGGQAMAACTVTYTFANGTTADATQVNQDFSDIISCAAPTASPTFTGTLTASATNVGGLMTHTAGAIEQFNRSDNARHGTVTYNANGLTLDGGANDGIYFDRNGTNSGSFGTDGSFLVGTTTNGGWTGAGLIVGQSPTKWAGSFHNSGSAGGGLLVRVDSTSVNIEQFNYGTTGVGSITTNGTSTSFNTTSDARLKTISNKQQSYRDVIKKLWVGDFVWKANHKPGFGVIAQQTYPLFSQAVTKPTTESGIWQVDYSKLSPLALWGVKDLYVTTNSQAERITVLEKEVKDLHQVNDDENARMQALETKLATLTRKINIQTARN